MIFLSETTIPSRFLWDVKLFKLKRGQNTALQRYLWAILDTLPANRSYPRNQLGAIHSGTDFDSPELSWTYAVDCFPEIDHFPETDHLSNTDHFPETDHIRKLTTFQKLIPFRKLITFRKLNIFGNGPLSGNRSLSRNRSHSGIWSFLGAWAFFETD